MRISELSRSSGVPVATVKYYLRERLLHDGVRTAATQAQYDESHVSRLRLIRALLGTGGLSVAVARDVLDQLERPPASVHQLLGVAQGAIPRPTPAPVDRAAAVDLVRELGWDAGPEGECAALDHLAEALAAMEAADFALPRSALLDYARAMHEVAEREVAAVPTGSVEAAVRYVVLGTILAEPLILALRRLAQIDASSRRFAPRLEDSAG